MEEVKGDGGKQTERAVDLVALDTGFISISSFLFTNKGSVSSFLLRSSSREGYPEHLGGQGIAMGAA